MAIDLKQDGKFLHGNLDFVLDNPSSTDLAIEKDTVRVSRSQMLWPATRLREFSEVGGDPTATIVLVPTTLMNES